MLAGRQRVDQPLGVLARAKNIFMTRYPQLRELSCSGGSLPRCGDAADSLHCLMKSCARRSK